MATIASLNIVFRGITGPLKSAVGSAKSTISSLKSSVLSLSGAMTGLGLGLSLGSVVKAAGDAERETRKLDAVLKSTGNAAGFTTEELKKFAADLQAITVFEDDATVGAMAVLATFKKIQGPIFKEAVQSAMDLSTVMGQDLHSSIMQIGKALNDPIKGITALTRAGVSFDEAQKKAIHSAVEAGNVLKAQQMILAELRSEFGGAAAADAMTMAGAIEQMKNAWGDMAETIGGKVSPAITQVAKDIQAAIKPDAGQSSVTKSAAINLGDVSNLQKRRDELLKQQDELLGKIDANAQQAQGFSLFGLGAVKASIEMRSLAADLNTVKMELDRVTAKQAENRKFLKEQKTEAPAVFQAMESVLTGMPSAFKGVFEGAIAKQKEMKEGFDRMKGSIVAAVAQGEKLTKMLDAQKEIAKTAQDSVIASIRTPMDDYRNSLAEIETALGANKISEAQAGKARLLAIQKLRDTLPDLNRNAGAIEFGSREAFSAQNAQPRETTQKEILRAAQRTADIAQLQLDHFTKTGEVVMSIP